MRELDHSVVLCVIEGLRGNERLRLGCNISAQSAIIDDFWWPILQVLRDWPSVAARLVIEITESATPPSIEAASEFVLCLRELGCRVAIDDFGAGLGTLEFIRQTRPDIVKIDKGYLHRARGELNSAQTLSHLVQLCKTLAPCVIIEGVETAADQSLATACGGEWGQGYLFGRRRSIAWAGVAAWSSGWRRCVRWIRPSPVAPRYGACPGASPPEGVQSACGVMGGVWAVGSCTSALMGNAARSSSGISFMSTCMLRLGRSGWNAS